MTLIELANSINLREKEIDYHKYLYELAQKRYREETIGDIDLLESKVNLMKAEHNLNTLLEEKSQKEKELLQTVNLPLDLSLSIEAQVDYAPLSNKSLLNFIELSKKNNLDILKAALNLELKQYEINISKSDLNPQAELYTNLNKTKTSDTLSKSLENFDQIWIFGVKLDWPFFDTTKTWSKIDAANWEYKKTKTDLADLIEKIALEAEKSYRQLINAKISVDISQEQSGIALRRLKIAERFYKRGRYSSGELEEKQIAYNEALLQELKTKIEYNLMKEKLILLIGGKMPNEG